MWKDKQVKRVILTASFAITTLLFSTQPLHATETRSIFRSVQNVEKPKEEPKPTAEEKTKNALKPALDPLSLLGDRPKTLIQSIQIPPEFGRISETHQGNPKPLVIHIQDVHVHYEAQKNLAGILDKLVKENGLRLILVEGGSGDTSLSFLRKEATKEKRLEVAEKYLKSGKISGEEYLDIISDNPITLWGIEDEKLYDENLDVFFKVDAIKEEASRVSHAIKSIVETLKANIYSPAVKDLERQKVSYEEGKTQAIDYYHALGKLAQDAKINLSKYPNFSNFLVSSDLEKKIDFQKVDGEHQALIGKLTQALTKEELTTLAEKGLKYKLNETGPKEYYGFLKGVLEKKDPAKGTHQNLDLYIDYVILYADRDHVELFREGKLLEKELKNRLSASQDERTLAEISDKLDLILSFLDLNLSPDDLTAYQADRESFLVKNWKKFVLDKINQYHLSAPFPVNISVIDNNLSLLESFYEVGMKRDGVLVKNAIAKIEEEKADVAVLIAGGFHSGEITRLLREKNYSYIVVAPKITQASDLELYHRILKEKARPATSGEENLRPMPARERGVAEEFEGDARDGGAKELTASLLQKIVFPKKPSPEEIRFILGDGEFPRGARQFSIPKGKRVAILQSKEWDPDFYAGNLITAFGQKGNTMQRFTLSANDSEFTALKAELRQYKPDFIFLPMNENDTTLRAAVEKILREAKRDVIFIFYKSLEVGSRFNLVVPFSEADAQRKEKAIQAHKSQIARIRYDEMAYAADKAYGLESGIKRKYRKTPNAERYVTALLKGGEVSASSEKIEWNRGTFRTMAKQGIPVVAIVAHPDDIAIMGGGLISQAVHNGLRVYSYILSTGSGASIPEVDQVKGLKESDRRMRKARIRQAEERTSAHELGITSSNFLGVPLLEKNPKMSEEDIVREAARQLPSNLRTILVGQRSDRVVVLLNSPKDPHPRHRAVYEESIKVLEELSGERPDITFHLVYLTFPEGENHNAFYPFTTGKEVIGPTEELQDRAEAARLTARALAKIAGEIVTVQGKGAQPIELALAEGFRVEPFVASDGASQKFAISERSPERQSRDGGRRGMIVIGPKRNLHIATSAVVEKGAIFDTRNGDITVGEHSVIQSGARIEGNVTIGDYVTVFGGAVIRGKNTIIRSGTESDRTEVSGVLEDVITGSSAKFYFNPTVIRSRFGDHAHVEGTATKIKDSEFGHYAYIQNVTAERNRGGHGVRLVDIRESLDTLYGNLVFIERVSEIRNSVISSMTVPVKKTPYRAVPYLYPVVVKNANQINGSVLFGGVNLIGNSYIHEGTILSFVHSGPGEREHTILVGTPFDPTVAPHFDYLGNMNSYGVTVRKKVGETWKHFEWDDPDIWQAYEAAYKHIFLGEPLPADLDVEFGRNNYGAFTSTSDYDPTTDNKGGVLVLGANVFSGIFTALQVPISAGPNTLWANKTFITHDIPPGSLAVGSRAAIDRQGGVLPEARVREGVFGMEKGSGVKARSLVERRRVDAVFRIFRANLAYGQAALRGVQDSYGIERIAWLRAAEIVLENAKAVKARSLDRYLERLEPTIERLTKELGKAEGENRDRIRQELRSQQKLLAEREKFLSDAELLLGGFESAIAAQKGSDFERTNFQRALAVDSSSLVSYQAGYGTASVVLLKQQVASLKGGRSEFPPAVRLATEWYQRLSGKRGAVSAPDGGQKITAVRGGEITIGAAIGQRPTQEDRAHVIQVSLAGIPNGEGNLLLVMDGHRSEEAAEYAFQHFPSHFEQAMRETNGHVAQAFQKAIASIQGEMQEMVSGTSLTAAYLPKKGKVTVATLGNSSFVIENPDETLLLGPEHDAVLNVEERKDAEGRGAIYIAHEGYLFRGERLGGEGFVIHDKGIGVTFTRSLGDGDLSFLSREPEIFELPFERGSTLLLMTKGLVQGLSTERGKRTVSEFLRNIHRGLSAQQLVDEQDGVGNATAIVYRSQTAKDGAHSHLRSLHFEESGRRLLFSP